MIEGLPPAIPVEESAEDVKRRRNRDYKRKERANKKAEEREQTGVIEAVEFLRALQTRDEEAQGVRFRSEARSYLELGTLYFGLQASELTRIQDAFVTGDQIVSFAYSNVKPAVTAILGEKLSFDQWLEMRDKARKNLFFLGSQVLGIKFLREHIHTVVFDQFVQKNFDGAFPEGYTSEDVVQAFKLQKRTADRTDNLVVTPSEEQTQQMMLLDPRAFGKSTCNRVDCISWLINVPDVRILILTGRRVLGSKFLQNIKSYLTLGDLGRPTAFHLLFPEYVHTSEIGTATMFISPARILNITDPTIEADGIESNLSGGHYDVFKGDDVVTDENSNTEATKASLKEKYDGVILNLPDEHGFIDMIGTRYYVDDYYGSRLNPGVDEDGNVLATPLKYFRRQAWIRKTAFLDEKEYPLHKLTEDMVTLTFPEKASFNVLRYKLRQNERSFRNQQLNEPTDARFESNFIITFTKDGLRAVTIMPAAAPARTSYLSIVMAGDLSTGSSDRSDYSALAAAGIWMVERKSTADPIQYGITVLKVAYGKWKQSEIATEIVKMYNEFKPTVPIRIERAAGADTLNDRIRAEAIRRGGDLPQIIFFPPSNQPNAKAARIKGLEILLTEGRFKLIAGPEYIEELYEQFEKFTGERGNRGRKDDIPDVISFLVKFLPASSQPNVNLTELKRESEERDKKRMRDDNYKALFGMSGKPQSGLFQPPITPPVQRNSASDMYRSAIRRIFGR